MARPPVTELSEGDQIVDQASLETFLQPTNFRGGCNIEALLDTLAQPIVDDHHYTGKKTEKNAVVTVLRKTDRMLAQFEKADHHLTQMQFDVRDQLSLLQDEVESNEAVLREQVAGLEKGLRDIQKNIRTIHERMGGVIRGASSFGERLQTADRVRDRALDAITIIKYMQAFARVVNFDDLPELFIDEAKLTDAASMTRRLLQIGNELEKSAEQMGGHGHKKGAATKLGSIEYAVERLERYHNELENRVVSRFDMAVAEADIKTMSECVRIMSEFTRGEDLLVQRYIATRPMFINEQLLVFGASKEEGGVFNTKMALHELSGLYEDIMTTINEERETMEQVFAGVAYKALALLVQRIFEQRVQGALDKLLIEPAANGTAADLTAYLSFLVEAYRKTKDMCDQVQDRLGQETNVSEFVDSVFSGHVGNYLDFEMKWLALKGEAASHSSRAASSDIVQRMLAWNTDAVDRCVVVSAESQRAHNVRLLCHASTAQRASTGCLLEQVAGNVMGGLSFAADTCMRGSAAPFTTMQQGQALRSTVAKSADMFVAQTLGRVMDAVKETTTIMEAVKGHFATVIEPHLKESPKEMEACRMGLSAFTRAAEEKVATTLNKALNALFAAVERTLTTEQKRTDFKPVTNQSVDRPTDGCVMVAAILRAALHSCEEALHNTNRTAFTAEIGRRLIRLLYSHMMGFTFNPLGALRWKRDVSEYADLFREFKVHTVEDKIEELQSVSNLMMVAPESLLSMVDTTLRMSHAQALKYIQLRDDFRTAKVDGKTLSALFAYD